MLKINGKVEYRGAEYSYTAEINEDVDEHAGAALKKITGAEGQSRPKGAEHDALKKLALENAKLLFWCKQEGWEVEKRSNDRSALISAQTGLIQRITLVDASKAPQTMQDPVILGLYNWADEQLGKAQIFKGGIDALINSPEFTPREPLESPRPVLKEGVIYSGDNGMLICVKCAGQSARYTGFDLSGQRVIPVQRSENARWRLWFGKDMRCEKGCTSYGDDDEDNVPKVPGQLRHSRQGDPETR